MGVTAKRRLSPRLVRLTRARYVEISELEARYEAATEALAAAQQLQRANGLDRGAYARAVYAADEAFRLQREIGKAIDTARIRAYPTFRALFEALAESDGVPLDGGDLEGDLRASLTLIRGGAS